MSSVVKSNRVKLGEVVAPSGTVAIVDSGYLYMWCHDKEPLLPPGRAEGQLARQANVAVDMRLDGKDGEHVGELLNRQWHPSYLYDIAPDAVEHLRQSVQAVCLQHNLEATLTTLPQRVPHRRRADLALEHGQGAGELQMHGIWLTVVAELPANRPLPVYGERMPDGPDEARWQRVYLECAEGSRVARSERVGYVMVDWARLLFADIDELSLWKHDEPMDGRCDVAFWGRDADEVAARLSAPALNESDFGWRDVSVEEAEKLIEQLKRARAGALKFAFDFRPHSHHYQLMEQIRQSAEESGVVQVGKAQFCGFMTTWGDGLFEVIRDFDNKGNLVRVRIEMGTPERVQLLRDLEQRWQLRTSFALVSKKALEGERGICWLFREAPDNERDIGWRIFAGDESDDELEDADNIAVLTINQLIEHDATLEQVIDSKIGCAFERKTQKHPFLPVEDWRPQED